MNELINVWHVLIQSRYKMTTVVAQVVAYVHQDPICLDGLAGGPEITREMWLGFVTYNIVTYWFETKLLLWQ